MSILASCRDSNCPSPIEIIKALKVRKLIESFLTHISAIVNNGIMRWGASACSYILSHQVVIKIL